LRLVLVLVLTVVSVRSSMIKAGGSSFFECWVPSQPRFSPYGAFASQSFCHAWSCTPSLLLRSMGLA